MPNVPNNNVIYDNLASGLDRNDGTNGKGGDKTPAELIAVNAAGGVTSIEGISINEFPDSPIIERAEQCTVTKHYRLSYTEAITRQGIYGRGALTVDSFGNYFRVLSCTTQYQGGAYAILTIIAESISFDVPPDEISINTVRLGLDIMKHPRYFYSLMPTNQIPNFTGIGDTDEQITAKQTIIRSIQAYRENPFIPTTNNVNNMVGLLHENIVANHVSGKFVISKANPNYNPAFKATDPIDVGSSAGLPPGTATSNGQPNPTTYFYAINTSANDPNGKIALALAAGKEIIGKLWRMEDTPIVNGIEMVWTSYSFRPLPLNLGGYIEDPSQATPPLPDYFYSTSNPPSASQTIFDNLSSFNPQCFSQNGLFGGPVAISWLRDADVIDYQRTWFATKRKWIGAPFGSWDADLYNQNDRPSAPANYRNLLMN